MRLRFAQPRVFGSVSIAGWVCDVDTIEVTTSIMNGRPRIRAFMTAYASERALQRSERLGAEIVETEFAHEDFDRNVWVLLRNHLTARFGQTDVI